MASSSVMALSFSFAPPPRINRLASPFDLAKPTIFKAAIMLRLAASAELIVT